MSAAEPILHAVTPPDPGRGGVAAGELVYAQIAARTSADDRVLILGASADRRVAMALGLRSVWLTPAPRHPLFATAAITRAARALGAGRVALWSRELLPTARRVRRVARVEARLLDEPGRGECDPWRPRTRDLASLERLVVPDCSAGHRWIEAGAEAARVETEPPAAMTLAGERAATRARLGVSGSIVLAPLSADPAGVDARSLLFVSGVLELLGHEHSLLVPDGAKRVVESMRFRRRTGLRTRFVMVPPPLLAALPAADVLVAPKSDGAPSSARAMLDLLAEGLGVPVASIAGWETEPGLGHGNLVPDIRENVSPVVEAYERVAQARRVAG
ncbi:MAG: hypothetical protein H6810_01375 [Phycisphaeraceae bacterium]|nr:MAG: hypothetical protein H6810_01375 [Phycisphaeraceae bacterium]